MQRSWGKLTTFHPYYQWEADLRVSRGGAEFKKIFSVVSMTFIVKVHHIVFPTSPKAPYTRGGFRGGGGGGRLFFPPGIRPPAHPKGPPFVLFWDLHFWLTDPTIFLKATLAPNYTKLRSAAPKKKTIFWSKFFKKCFETPFLVCFFSKNFLRRKKFVQSGFFIVIWESWENQFGQPK